MVHVKKCPLGRRGQPSTEFYIDGKPQIYCLGRYDKRTDAPLPDCQNCKDFVYNDQAEFDFMAAEGKRGSRVSMKM